MTDASLARECDVFTRALAGTRPSGYVQEQYRKAHGLPTLEGRPEGVDRALCHLGRLHPWMARVADAYAGRFARRGLFRTKLVLILGLLESSPPHFRRYEDVPKLRIVSLFMMGVTVSVEVVRLLLGILVFGPVHAWAHATRRREPNG